MQEKIAQMTKTVTSLTKEKGITDDPSLQREPMSWKDGVDPSIVPNPNDCCEQEELRKKSSGRSNQVNMQQRCSLLDEKLKEMEDVNNLESVDPKELCLVPDIVIPSKFKMPKFEKYDEIKCPENHLAMYCNKMAGHARNEDLLNHAGGHSKNRMILKDEVQTLIRADLTRFRRTCRWPPKVLRYRTN